MSLEFVTSLPLFQLTALEFPPKKLFGNRDERVVAERRNHLEAGHLTVLFTHITMKNCRVRYSSFCETLLWGIEMWEPGSGSSLCASAVSFTALPEELVPGDAVVLQLSSQSRHRQRFPSVQTRYLWVFLVLQEGRVRAQQPRHRLTRLWYWNL